MIAILSQSEDPYDDENEKKVINMCFMTFKDKDEVNYNFDNFVKS